MAKINQLKQLAKQTGLTSTSLARITTLPVYSETEEVAKILREMLEVREVSDPRGQKVTIVTAGHS